MKDLNRRTILKGIGGIALGLPWLEASAQSSLTRKRNNVRLAYIYMPNGVDSRNWTPSGQGKDYKFSKSLEPLKSIKHMVNVHTNLAHPHKANHLPSTSDFLSGALIPQGGELSATKTVDQVAAEHLGKDSFLPSLELSTSPARVGTGMSPDGYLWTYGSFISWVDNQTPVPREIYPLRAFNRLFNNKQRKTHQVTTGKSILDYIREDTARVKRSLGREDNYRVAQYFHSVRALERRIEKLSKDTFVMPNGVVRPKDGQPQNQQEYIEIMTDLMVLAFQTKRTNVASFMTAKSIAYTDFSYLPGVQGKHHALSHHGRDNKKRDMIQLITRHHVELYARMLKKMHSIKEGDKTLLDNSLVLFGSSLWDGNAHNAPQRPLLVAGKGGGKVQTGLHQVHKRKTPMNNLLLGMLQTAGCPVESFGNSTGAII